MLQVLLTSDIIDSKLIQDLDCILKEKLNLFNKMTQQDLITEAYVSRGDEIQFILKFNQNFFKNILLFRSYLFPIKIRTAASLTTSNLLQSVKIKSSWELNGVDFFYVRELLDNNLKKEKEYILRFYSTFNKYDNILNAYFSLSDIVHNNWNDKHWEIIKLLLIYNENKEVSRRLNLFSKKNGQPTQTYYDRLNKSKIQKVLSSSNEIIKFFEKEGLIKNE